MAQVRNLSDAKLFIKARGHQRITKLTAVACFELVIGLKQNVSRNHCTPYYTCAGVCGFNKPRKKETAFSNDTYTREFESYPRRLGKPAGVPGRFAATNTVSVRVLVARAFQR